MTLTDLIANGYSLGSLPSPPQPVLPNTRCALTGAIIDAGYPVMDIVSDAQGEWWETFNGQPDGWLSESAARCWILGSNPKKDLRCSKSMAVFGDAAFEPMISQKSANEQGRPSWRDLVRYAWDQHRGQSCAIVLSTDTKKRVWWRGRAGILGTNTPVLIYDTGYSLFRVVNIDWAAMLDDLAVIESVYAMGFSKGGINTSLFKESKIVESVGIAQVIAAEKKLSQLRKSERFLFCLLIAQVVEDEVKCTNIESQSQLEPLSIPTTTNCTEQYFQGSLFG